MNMFAEHPQLHSCPVDVSEYRSWPPPGHRPTRFAACGATEGATGVAGGLVGLGAEGVVLPQFATTNPIRRATAQLVRLLRMTVRPRCNAGSAQCHQRPRFVQSGAMGAGVRGLRPDFASGSQRMAGYSGRVYYCRPLALLARSRRTDARKP